MYLLTKSLVHLTPLKTIVISTKDGCPTLLASDGYFGQTCTLCYFYSCLFCKFKLIKGANKVVVVVGCDSYYSFILGRMPFSVVFAFMWAIKSVNSFTTNLII